MIIYSSQLCFPYLKTYKKKIFIPVITLSNLGSSSTWRNWYGVEPNGGTKQNCALLDYHGNGAEKWFDVPCETGRYFVCKVPSKNRFLIYIYCYQNNSYEITIDGFQVRKINENHDK